MSELAKLLVPAVRWNPDQGFEGQRAHIERALSAGVGGFILFGGESAAVKDLAAELRERSNFPILVAADLERGAGQQFSGATGLPPLAAIGASAEADAAAMAARLTAREALSLGVNWVLAPVCDLDVESSNPIVGTRSFGGDVEHASALASEWIDACQAQGALACAKHFPGHGRTSVDSHAALPVVAADSEELWNSDLAPFRSAIEAGVASVLTAHVAYPALDPAGAPATLSRPIIRELLRNRLGFQGIIVTDAMIMEGVLQGRSEETACIDALAAGCDLILYPLDLTAVSKAVERAAGSGMLDSEELRLSLERRERWAAWAAGTAEPVGERERNWALDLARGCVHTVREPQFAVSSRLDVLLIDDDVGGPYPPPSRAPFIDALRAGGFDARLVDTPSLDGRRSLVIALFGDIRSWKGRAGYAAASINAAARALARDAAAIVVQFSHPRLAAELPREARFVVSAWGGERVMQQAAADWLAARSRA